MTDDLTASMIYIRHKIVFVGDPATGKTSLMKRIVDNEFNPDYDATIGVDFFTKVVSYRENVFKLQLWDSAGQEKYKSLINILQELGYEIKWNWGDGQTHLAIHENNENNE